jgi:hypothetical protein
MQELIERIARENGASEDAIRKWRSLGAVPTTWRFRIFDKALEEGVRLTSEHFDALKPMFRRPQRGKREAA